MPTTLGQAIVDVRSRLDEVMAYTPTAPPGTSPGRMWNDTELTSWINEATRDIARRTETIKNFSSYITTSIGQAKYVMPPDVIRIHRVEFIPTGNTSNVYNVQASTYQEMQQFWGITPTTQQSYPYYYMLWGFPPNLIMQLYPVPSQVGTLNLYYYRVPQPAVTSIDYLEIPEGWQDLISLYCEYVCRRKNRDPMWSDTKKLYEENITLMIDVTREWHDQSKTIFMGNSAIPQWLYGGMDY